MTLESLEFRRPTVSKSGTKTKSIIVMGAFVLTIIVAFGVATGIGTSLPSSPMKLANCTQQSTRISTKRSS